MGFGDLFIAALVGCLSQTPPTGRYVKANLTYRPVGSEMGRRWSLALALGFDLLFFAVDTLPATVPVAVALAIADPAKLG